jgi:hypothetical protein
LPTACRFTARSQFSVGRAWRFYVSPLAQWVGVTGVQLRPLVDALRELVFKQQVVHADETPVQMLVPGSKKTHRSYVWACATRKFYELAAVFYDFNPKRNNDGPAERLLGISETERSNGTDPPISTTY